MNPVHCRSTLRRTLRCCVLAAALLAAALPQAQGQLYRANDRTWHAWRGGLLIGYSRSLHHGDVPMAPAADNTIFADGAGDNATFGVLIEKPLSRFIALGATLTLDPLSAEFSKTVQDPFRIADPQGNLYNVKREQSVEYTLPYVTMHAYAKLYPSGGPGFFVGGSFGVGTLGKATYKTSAIIVEPTWARGSQSLGSSGDIPGANDIRWTVGAMFGYELFFKYGFIAPQIQYDFALNNISDAPFAENWSADNLRAMVTVTFPLP